jgi:glycopeptide antibiotics resistance protein
MNLSDRSFGLPSTNWPSERRLRAVWLTVALALLAFAWYGSLVPFHFWPISLSDAWTRFTKTNVDWTNGSKVDWGVNSLLLIPTAFCLLGAVTRTKAGLGERLAGTVAVAAVCLAMSLCIEFSQNWFPPRVPSLADVVAQFMGAAAGLVGWWLFGTRFNRALAEFLSNTRSNSRFELLLLAYLVGLIVYSLAPLDLTLHPIELFRKYRDGRIQFVPFAPHVGSGEMLFQNILPHLLLFVPVGLCSATFRSARDGAIRSVSGSFFVGGCFVAVIELLQVFVVSRYADATDLVTGFAGVAAGVSGYHYFSGRAAERAAPTARIRIRLLIYASLYVILLSAVFCSPFNFTTSDTTLIRQRMSQFFGVPLSSALQGDYLSALGGFLQKFLLFVPLGLWIALFTSTLRPAMQYVANLGLYGLTVLLALAFELVQIVLPSRYGSFDDVVICAAGSLFGLWAASRVRVSHLSARYTGRVLSTADKRLARGSKVSDDVFPKERRANET